MYYPIGNNALIPVDLSHNLTPWVFPMKARLFFKIPRYFHACLPLMLCRTCALPFVPSKRWWVQTEQPTVRHPQRQRDGQIGLWCRWHKRSCGGGTLDVTSDDEPANKATDVPDGEPFEFSFTRFGFLGIQFLLISFNRCDEHLLVICDNHSLVRNRALLR